MEKGHAQETATGNLSDNRELPAKMVESIYTTMCRIRAFEQHTIDLFNEGVVKGTAHSYMGEEAIASAVCANLRKDDFIASYHRGHGHCIAKGLDTKKIINKQISCRMTYTNESVHKIISKNIKRSAMYSGNIQGVGPRYCPSIEDKIVK